MFSRMSETRPGGVETKKENGWKTHEKRKRRCCCELVVEPSQLKLISQNGFIFLK